MLPLTCLKEGGAGQRVVPIPGSSAVTVTVLAWDEVEVEWQSEQEWRVCVWVYCVPVERDRM